MTKEEYLSKTSIKSVEEARSILNRLRVIFWVVFIWLVVVRGAAGIIQEDVYFLIWLGYIVFLIYFVVYCIKVIKLTKAVTNADALWSILFAPISWLYFYPAITDPLKIIIGEKEPPEKMPERKFDEIKHNASQRKWKIAFIVFVVALVSLLFLTLVYVAYESGRHPAVTGNKQTTPGVSVTASENADGLSYKFQSTDFGFKVNFPSQPTREDETQSSDVVGNIKTTTYTSASGISGDESSYLVMVGQYANEKMNTDLPDFNLDAALEGALNGMANADMSSKLISSEKRDSFGTKALRYKIQYGEEYVEGLLFYKGQRQYNVMVDYFISAQKPDVEAFLDSFELSG